MRKHRRSREYRLWGQAFACPHTHFPPTAIAACCYLCRVRLAVWCGARRVVGCLVGWSSFLICGTSPMPGSGGFERVGVVSWASSAWDCSCCCCLVWTRSKVFTASSLGVCGLSWSMIQFEFWITRSPVARMVSSSASAHPAMYPVEYSAVSRPKYLLTR